MRNRRPRPEASKDDPTLPIVSLVGRPNVGKSSLFNRLVGGRPAIVEDRPGVTRDRRYGICEWDRTAFRVCDTGGLDPSADGILGAMRGQTMRAVDEAAVLVLVLDAVEGVTAVDQDVARLLRRSGKPVLVAANKVDSGGRESLAGDMFRLGFPDVFPVSASHGRGVNEMLDAVLARLGDSIERGAPNPAPRRAIVRSEEEPAPEPSFDRPIRLTFVGKPNAGKSSLVNRLLGEERVLVHHEPGTTVDPIDTPFEIDGRRYVLVDTAGIRRRKMVKTLTEAVSAKMARDQIERSDVVALVMDLDHGPTDDDARLASLVEESGRALIVIMNKSDLIPRAQYDARATAAKDTLSFVGYAPFLSTSAATGRGVRELLQQTAAVYDQWTRRVPTSELNRHFEEMVEHRPPPSGPSGKHVKLYYITQVQVAPPTFFVSTNLPAAIGYPYRRYLMNQLRKVYGFSGTPIKLALRGHARKKPGGSAALSGDSEDAG